MQIIKQYSWAIILAAVVCVFLIMWMREPRGDAAVQQLEEVKNPSDNQMLTESPAENQTASDNEKVMVDIKGEVQNPGVYELAPDSRVEQALNAAGGLTENAEGRSINLAQRVADEQVIYVAAIGEADVPVQTAGSSTSSEKININQADSEELTELNGIGEAKAQAIITFREENGPFTSIEQLTEVPGIGEKSLENLKDQISL
ncbi:competence protein ComEA [Terribacillus saccharophilus]|uniref:Competence protein ComEA n=1 Tax=Terribacillus saccharophilus TaxID=361277 RepID=A0AAX2EA98_9BACI|nr:ComEA family DNA-binding protein [Terribacillus saccharophilus]MCM3224427.1 ComEA family DNA-binding protein [Terribacillus saccharophilus]SEM54688.1 competence protein ComEA [Terribacillus saccharophilus]